MNAVLSIIEPIIRAHFDAAPPRADNRPLGWGEFTIEHEAPVVRLIHFRFGLMAIYLVDGIDVTTHWQQRNVVTGDTRLLFPPVYPF